MTQQIFIDGDADEIQLRVQGHSDQDEPLQTWEDSTGAVLAQVTGDGRFEAGDMSLMTTDESLIEAHEQGTSASVIQRGVNTLGKFTGAISNAITWVMSELQLFGGDAISGIHTALRAKLVHDNDSNDSSAADLRAGDFEAVNQSGSSGTPVGDMTGVQGRVDNQTGAYLTNARGVAAQIANGSGSDIEKAAAFEVLPPVNSGQIDTLIGLEIADISDYSGNTDNYAIRTGAGKVKFGALTNGLLKSVAGVLANAVKGTDYDVPMVGATSLANGQAGVVPQPLIADKDKFLKGDGTWATPAGGGGASALGDLSDVDTTGASANDVLTFDGTGWTPQASSGGGAHTHIVSDITDAGNMAYQDKANVDIDGGDIDGVSVTATYIVVDAMEVDWARFVQLVIERDTWSNHKYTVANSAAYHSIDINRARGTVAVPTAIVDGDTLGQIKMKGYDGSSYADGPRIRSVAKSDWSGGTSREANLEFFIADATATHLAARLEEHGALGLADVISTPGSASGWSKLWSDSGELKVKDALGNTTTLSSHNPQLVDVSDRPTSYVHAESNPFTGRYVEFDLYGALTALEALSGQQFIFVGDLPQEAREDWDANEQALVAERNLEIQHWEATPPEQRVGTKPPAYVARPEPAFIAAARKWVDTRNLAEQDVIAQLQSRIAALEAQVAGS